MSDLGMHRQTKIGLVMAAVGLLAVLCAMVMPDIGPGSIAIFAAIEADRGGIDG